MALRLGGTAVRAAEPAARSSLLSGVDLTFQTWPGCKLRRWQAHAHMCIYVHIRDTEHSRHELSSRRRPRKQTPKFTSLHQGPGTRDPLLQSHTFPHHGDAPGAPVHRGCCGGKACPLSPGEKDKGPRLPPPFRHRGAASLSPPWRKQEEEGFPGQVPHLRKEHVPPQPAHRASPETCLSSAGSSRRASPSAFRRSLCSPLCWCPLDL